MTCLWDHKLIKVCWPWRSLKVKAASLTVACNCSLSSYYYNIKGLTFCVRASYPNPFCLFMHEGFLNMLTVKRSFAWWFSCHNYSTYGYNFSWLHSYQRFYCMLKISIHFSFCLRMTSFYFHVRMSMPVLCMWCHIVSDLVCLSVLSVCFVFDFTLCICFDTTFQPFEIL